MEEQQIFELQRVSVGTRVLDLVTKGDTLRTLIGEPDHVEVNGVILKEFLASHDPGPVRVEETDWLFSIAAGIFSRVGLLATVGFALAFLKRSDNKSPEVQPDELDSLREREGNMLSWYVLIASPLEFVLKSHSFLVMRVTRWWGLCVIFLIFS